MVSVVSSQNFLSSSTISDTNTTQRGLKSLNSQTLKLQALSKYYITIKSSQCSANEQQISKINTKFPIIGPLRPSPVRPLHSHRLWAPASRRPCRRGSPRCLPTRSFPLQCLRRENSHVFNDFQVSNSMHHRHQAPRLNTPSIENFEIH